MKEEVILRLSELRSQINDTIARVEKESAAEGKEIVSMLMSCDFVNVYDLLKEETGGFLEYMENIGFIKTKAETVYCAVRSPFTQYKRVPIHDWIDFTPSKGWKCHPALIALYKNYLENS
ncbi:hypothetical protein [Ruminococcus intestinalis]|uniref:hypothetical protein n=1 Tax=Ruminococcus intestinalis TaxID=2763066 RepID=UPI003F8069C0